MVKSAFMFPRREFNQGGHMMKLRCGIAIAIMVMTFSCKIIAPDGGPAPVTAENLRLANNEISGWCESGLNLTNAGYTSVQGLSELEGLIDGGAAIYYENGFTAGILQEMMTQASQTCAAWVMDFGTPEKAKQMVEVQRANAASPSCLPTLPDSIAFVNDNISKAFGYDSKFYFEIRVGGFPDVASRHSQLEIFMKTYFAKII
jgi:hypothetical protein